MKEQNFYDNINDTHKEYTLSNRTQALTESMNMDIWKIGTSNQLFIRGSHTLTNKKNEVTS